MFFLVVTHMHWHRKLPIIHSCESGGRTGGGVIFHEALCSEHQPIWGHSLLELIVGDAEDWTKTKGKKEEGGEINEETTLKEEITPLPPNKKTTTTKAQYKQAIWPMNFWSKTIPLCEEQTKI